MTQPRTLQDDARATLAAIPGYHHNSHLDRAVAAYECGDYILCLKLAEIAKDFAYEMEHGG